MWSRLRQQAVTKNWMRTSRIKCEMVGRQFLVRQNISVPFQDPTITYEEVTRAALTGRKAVWPDPRFPADVFLAVVWGLQTELRATGRFSSGDVVPLLFGLGWREWWGLKPTYLIMCIHLYNFVHGSYIFLYCMTMLTLVLPGDQFAEDKFQARTGTAVIVSRHQFVLLVVARQD